MSQVFDLKRGCFIHYTLSPLQAVIAAHQQYDRKNFNTWTYGSSPRDTVHYKTIEREVIDPNNKKGITKIHMVSCGNFSCIYSGKIDENVPQDYELGTDKHYESLKDEAGKEII